MKAGPAFLPEATGRQAVLLGLIAQATAKETRSARLAGQHAAQAARHRAVRFGLEALLPEYPSGGEPDQFFLHEEYDL